MITVKVTLVATGKVGIDNKYFADEFTTGFNGTFEDATKYYFKNIFNMGLWYDAQNVEHEDNLMMCVGCKLLSGN